MRRASGEAPGRFRRRYRIRHSRGAYRGALPGTSRDAHPAHHPAARTGRGIHGGRLRARVRQARRMLHHHRARDDQHPDGDGPGLRRLRADAGDLERQQGGAIGHGGRTAARASLAAQSHLQRDRIQSHPDAPGRAPGRIDARLRDLRECAPAADPYRDSHRCHHGAGRSRRAENSAQFPVGRRPAPAQSPVPSRY